MCFHEAKRLVLVSIRGGRRVSTKGIMGDTPPGVEVRSGGGLEGIADLLMVGNNEH